MGIIFYLCVRPLTSEPICIMALRTGSNDWQELLTKMGFPADSALTYAKNFVEESITKDSLNMRDREVLKELGVTTMGHSLSMLKLTKEQPLISGSYMKAPAVKLPRLNSGITFAYTQSNGFKYSYLTMTTKNHSCIRTKLNG